MFKSKAERRHAALFLCAALCTHNAAWAQSTPTELADLSLEDLLDVEIGGEKLKHAQKWELSASFKKLDIGGYKNGTRDLSFDEVLFSAGEMRTQQNYPVVPTFICQVAFSLSAKYQIDHNTAIGVQVPYLMQDTEHISSVPGFADFTLSSKGLGDIAVGLSRKLSSRKNQNISIQAGLRLPVGDINVMGDTPRGGAGTMERLPYTMQLGSGTLDLTGGFNYGRQFNSVKLNANVNAVVRTGTNDNNYRLGNNYAANFSATHVGHTHFEPFAKASLRKINSINGIDKGLTIPGEFPFPASITDPSNYGGEKIVLTAGTKLCLDSHCDSNVTGEIGVPIYQNLNGIQPKEQSRISLALGTRF